MDNDGRRIISAAFAAFFLGSSTLIGGCSAKYYRARADKAAYAIVAEKQKQALGQERSFSIEKTEPGIREVLALQPATGSAVQSQFSQLTLNEALKIAAKNSRDYQSQRENLYLSALSLSGERHLWRPGLSWNLFASLSRSGGDTTQVDAQSDFSLSQLFITGARAAIGFTTDFFRIVSSPTSNGSSSRISANIVQPLLRGAGARIALEPLTQAERDVIYDVRSFTRFQKEFAVQVASDFYRVLQRQDSVDNQYANYQSLIASRERTEAMAQAGRLPTFQIDQARQQELSARNSWITVQAQYEQSLDQFRITLGAPPGAPITLSKQELADLRNAVVELPQFKLEDAVSFALQNRFDLLNTRDSVEDAGRKLLVAQDKLRAELNITPSASISTESGKPLDFQWNEGTYTLAADADLPLDRVAERNNYRAAIITLARQQRSLEALEDSVKLGVRQAQRSLAEAAQSYEIQKLSVDLAKRRVESTNLLLEAGRAQTRDVLDANQSLIESQNALTAAIANFRVAYLQFLRDTELLEVDTQGLIIERKDLQWTKASKSAQVQSGAEPAPAEAGKPGRS